MLSSVIYQLSVTDYIVFALTIVISLGIGVYYACKGQKTTSEFIVASRSMKVIPLAISLMVSFESSIMMLGMPAEIYIYGLSYILSMIGFSISEILSGFIFAPFFRRQKVTSIFEYLEKRFQSTKVRFLGTTLGIMSYMCYLGIVLFGPGIALEAVTGIPLWSSIIVVALGSAIYTSMGGMKAVVWTDVFQSVIMYSGMIAVFVKGCMTLGGFQKIWTTAYENRRLEFDFSMNPYIRHTVFNVLFSAIIRGFGLIFNQSTVQRISSTRNVRDARLLLFIVSPLFCITTGFSMIIGLLAFAYFNTVQCDPLEANIITNPNQIMPLFVTHAFQHVPGLPGLFIASLFSASLSTLSSGLSSLSTITWIDLIKPRIKGISEVRATLIAKTAVFLYGILAIFLAFLVSLIGGPLTQIANVLISTFSAPLTGLHLYATLCPWGQERGALIGTLFSCGITLWMAYGSAFSPTRLKTPLLPPANMDKCIMGNDTFGNTTASYYVLTTALPIEKQEIHGLDKFYSLSYTLIGVVGIFSMIIIGTIIDLPSYNPQKVDNKQIVHLFDEICCCLPNWILRLFRCGTKPLKHSDSSDEELEAEREKILQSVSCVDYPRKMEMTVYSTIHTEKADPDPDVYDKNQIESKTRQTGSTNDEDDSQKAALLSNQNRDVSELKTWGAVVAADIGVSSLKDQEVSLADGQCPPPSSTSDEDAIEEAIAHISQSVHEMEKDIEQMVKGDSKSVTPPLPPPPDTPPMFPPPPTILNADSVSDLTLSDREDIEKSEDGEFRQSNNE